MKMSFFDVSATDLIGGYLQKEQIKAEAEVARYNAAPVAQVAALNNAEMKSQEEAIAGGSVSNGVQDSYFDRIPKPMLYGGLGLLALGVVAKVMTK